MASGKTSTSPCAGCVKDVRTFARVSNQLGCAFGLIHARIEAHLGEQLGVAVGGLDAAADLGLGERIEEDDPPQAEINAKMR